MLTKNPTIFDQSLHHCLEVLTREAVGRGIYLSTLCHVVLVERSCNVSVVRDEVWEVEGWCESDGDLGRSLPVTEQSVCCVVGPNEKRCAEVCRKLGQAERSEVERDPTDATYLWQERPQSALLKSTPTFWINTSGAIIPMDFPLHAKCTNHL